MSRLLSDLKDDGSEAPLNDVRNDDSDDTFSAGSPQVVDYATIVRRLREWKYKDPSKHVNVELDEADAFLA